MKHVIIIPVEDYTLENVIDQFSWKVGDERLEAARCLLLEGSMSAIELAHREN